MPPAADDAQLRRAALTGRSDVQELLGEYAAAESALALAIAGQYPNLTLSPGYSFDTVQNRYLLMPALDIPLNRNQGAIAVARSRREEAAARFTALQVRIIAAVDEAQVQYRAASREETLAATLLAGETEREQRTEHAFGAGALDRPGLLTVKLERNASAQARLAVRVRERRALGALEDALQHPLLGPGLPPLPTYERPLAPHPPAGTDTP
jgi:outer membrane protein TolC